MPKAYELKSCPHEKDGEAILVRDDSYEHEKKPFFVECTKCGAVECTKCGARTAYYPDIKKAVVAWNRRANDEPNGKRILPPRKGATE